MPGRRLLSDAEAAARGYAHPQLAERRRVLRETLARLEERGLPHWRDLAARNLSRWRAEATSLPRLLVLPGDWGEVTGALARRAGETFAVLNMANAFVPGGAYTEGTAAQEENLFRRTDCHFAITDDLFDARTERYVPWMTTLIEGDDGRVLLDTATPRTCIRGPEDRSRADLGYPWLADDEVFPFFELRSAGVDLRGGVPYDEPEMRRRVVAQLDTLEAAGVRHVVLSAFGCGAFGNPADRVAVLYREALEARLDRFAVVAFAIFAPGYPPDNHGPFLEALRPLGPAERLP